jgi:hypothetical protein
VKAGAPALRVLASQYHRSATGLIAPAASENRTILASASEIRQAMQQRSIANGIGASSAHSSEPIADLEDRH